MLQSGAEDLRKGLVGAQWRPYDAAREHVDKMYLQHVELNQIGLGAGGSS